MSEFIVVPKSEYKLLKQVIDCELTRDEGLLLLEHRDVILKLLDKAQTQEQIKLSIGMYQGKESEVYNGIKAMQRVRDSLDEIDKGFQVYNKNMEDLKAQAEGGLKKV